MGFQILSGCSIFFFPLLVVGSAGGAFVGFLSGYYYGSPIYTPLGSGLEEKISMIMSKWASALRNAFLRDAKLFFATCCLILKKNITKTNGDLQLVSNSVRMKLKVQIHCLAPALVLPTQSTARPLPIRSMLFIIPLLVLPSPLPVAAIRPIRLSPADPILDCFQFPTDEVLGRLPLRWLAELGVGASSPRPLLPAAELGLEWSERCIISSVAFTSSAISLRSVSSCCWRVVFSCRKP